MELNQVLAICRRWISVIIGVVVVIALGIFLNLRRTADVHSTVVRLQLTAPDRDDVRLVDEYRFVNNREEATSARNNFTELAGDRTVYDATQEILDLADLDMDYEIDVSAVQDSDFVLVKFSHSSPDNLVEIANVHVAETIKALGNTRALASESSLNAYSIQLEDSVENLKSAENTLAAFQDEHEIIALDQEIKIEQRVIENLEIEKAQFTIELATQEGAALSQTAALAELEAQISIIELQIQEEMLKQLETQQSGILSAVDAPESLTASEKSTLNNLEDSIATQTEEVQKLRVANLERQRDLLVAELEILKEAGTDNPAVLLVNTQIAERRANLTRLANLEPEYNILKANAEGALETYELVLTKFNESEVRAEVNRGASFVQVVANANGTFSEPNPMMQFLVLGITAGLALGILIAFILESFYPQPPDKNDTVSIDDKASNKNLNDQSILAQSPADSLEKSAASS